MRPRHNITLTEFTNTFVPSGLLVVAALLAAETTNNLDFGRLRYSIWVAMVLLASALCLYILPKVTEQRESYRLLLWTFGYLTYLIHFYYAAWVHYHGIVDVFKQQGPVIATSNFLVTLWWGLDVVLAWWANPNARWVKVQRIAAHLYIPITFFVSSVVIFKGSVHKLGLALTAVVLVCLLIRIVVKLTATQAAATPSIT